MIDATVVYQITVNVFNYCKLSDDINSSDLTHSDASLIDLEMVDLFEYISTDQFKRKLNTRQNIA